MGSEITFSKYAIFSICAHFTIITFGMNCPLSTMNIMDITVHYKTTNLCAKYIVKVQRIGSTLAYLFGCHCIIKYKTTTVDYPLCTFSRSKNVCRQ